MKKLIAMLLICTMVLPFTACGKTDPSGSQNEQQIEAKTIASKLQVSFLKHAEEADSKESLARTIMDENKDAIDIDYDVAEVQEGYLNGFQNEISGFSSAVVFCPYIGSIPFIGYIFETEDAEGLKNQLEKEHQLNWNICTMADEMIIEQSGNLVLFVMAPETMDD